MIRFYEGSGSSEIDLLEQSMPSPEWARLKAVAVKLLHTRGHDEAAEFLASHPFEIHHGTNGFGDEFELLYMKVSMTTYVELAALAVDRAVKFRANLVANAMREVGKGIRFIAAELDTAEGPGPVAQPALAITSDVVERALNDAERLLAGQGATSGVDRVHTAFHGYLRALLEKEAIAYPGSAGITELFRLLRDRHPALQAAVAQQAEADKILRALANIVDTLNPVRNHGSVAHANKTLLQEPEAMLVINSVRTLLHYLNFKTR